MLGSWRAWFLRPTGRLAQPLQVNMLSQRQQHGTEAHQVDLREDRPLLLLNGDVESIGGASNLRGQVVLRDRFIDLGLGMRGAQCGHDHGIEVEGHQRQAEAEQRRLWIAQGVELGVEMPLELLKRRLDTPSQKPR